MPVPTRLRSRLLLLAAVTGLALVTACGGPDRPEAVVHPVSLSPEVDAGSTARFTYDLGDTAYAPPGSDGQLTELKAAVTYPRELGGGKHPLVMVLHGWADTCRAGDAPVRPQVWPCGANARPVDNYLGYSYLADALAEKGYVVVSVSANGIQAHEKKQGNLARAGLLDEHLRMWQQLSEGKGPLRSLSRFKDRVDLDRVGTLGHSRGGGGVLTEVLDGHERPPGVNVRATMAFAPAMNGIDAAKERISRVPVTVVAGSCDAMWDDSAVPLSLAAGGPHAARIELEGGNHNYFNTVWTPGSGPAFAADDVALDHRDLPGGRCRSTNGTGDPVRLGPAEQRRAAIDAATAFFGTYLK
ncbi:alpha/beta hydrolase [Streptomyces sp. NPDC059917]|uniref:alpha/beta hydrolase n=1 Tax=Streptomyces sp. NPDC059917 TaxID=3347002 RepID=UPI003662CF30